MDNLVKQLSHYQSENQKLIKMTQNNIKASVNSVDQDIVKKYQLLEEENVKMQEELLMMRQNKVEEGDGYNRLKQEKS